MLFHSPYKTLNCHPDLLSITKTLHWRYPICTPPYRIPLPDIDKDKDEVNQPASRAVNPIKNPSEGSLRFFPVNLFVCCIPCRHLQSYHK